MVGRITRAALIARLNDPEYRREYEAAIKANVEAGRRPWSELALAVIEKQGNALSPAELGFVKTMARSKAQPSNHNLSRLAGIAMRFGIHSGE